MAASAEPDTDTHGGGLGATEPAAGAAACGSSGGGGNAIRNSTTTVPPATTTTTGVARAHAAVLTDWRAALRANVAAAKDPTGGAVVLLTGYFVDPELSFLTTQYVLPNPRIVTASSSTVRRRCRRTLAVALAACVAAGAAACGYSGGGGNAIRNSTTTVPPATTTTTGVAQAQAAVLTDWRAALRANEAAAKDPTGGAVVLLTGYFVDPELSFLTTQYDERIRDGFVDIGTLDLGEPRVVSMTATQAVVTTCETNALQMITKATGKPVAGLAGDPEPTAFGVRSALVLAPDGLWKVSDSKGTVGSCAGD